MLNTLQPNNLEGEYNMADNKILEEMLAHLVNEDQEKAEELFHEYVVAKSREIYENLIDSEISEEAEEDDEEGSEGDEADEDKMDENFEDIAYEGEGDEETDDLEGELDAMGPEEGEEEEKSEEELFQDLDSIVDELQAKFDELKGGDDMGDDDMDMGDDDMGDDDMGDEMKDDFDLETVREYVEKVPTPKMGDKGENNGLKFSKNDMGGTAANIATGKEGTGKNTGGLADINAKEDNAGNINVPGGKAGSAFSKKEPGHGAEKKGAAESGADTASLFRGRR